MSTAMQVSQNSLEPFRQAFAKAQDAFKDALPVTVAKYLTPERMSKVVLSAIARNPLLLQCTPTSVLKCVMESCALGLEPTGGILGHCYLVPYRNGKTGQYEAQLVCGYRGLIDLARRSGTVKSVEAHVVYAKDKFELSFGLEPRLIHTPSLVDDRGDIVAVYCVAIFSDGSRHCEVMTKSEVDAIRDRSRARDNGPWKTDYSEMARKTVVRRAAKYWPLSTELRQGLVQALEIEDAAETADTPSVSMMALTPMPEVAPSEPAGKRKTSKLAEKIRGETPHDPITGVVDDTPAGDPPPLTPDEIERFSKIGGPPVEEREPGGDA